VPSVTACWSGTLPWPHEALAEARAPVPSAPSSGHPCNAWYCNQTLWESSSRMSVDQVHGLPGSWGKPCPIWGSGSSTREASSGVVGCSSPCRCAEEAAPGTATPAVETASCRCEDITKTSIREASVLVAGFSTTDDMPGAATVVASSWVGQVNVNETNAAAGYDATHHHVQRGECDQT
jgi:hypothetical protein